MKKQWVQGSLHLVLKSKWYDKIASGEKTSEYRELKPYWTKRLTGLTTHDNRAYMGLSGNWASRFTSVIFHKGYTNETMEFGIREISILTGKPNDLGVFQCWEIKLGQRIK